MGDWIAFWDSEHSIYVNASHRDVHYRRIAQDIRALLPPDAAVLDYGCGEALHADLVARAARRLLLCEAAPLLRARLAERFRADRTVEVCSPTELASLRPGSMDVVVMHSVAQYLTPPGLERLLRLFRRLLGNKGLLILGDIIPLQVSAATDAMALLRFAAANGFLGAALIGLLRTLASDYWRLRSQHGLTRYSEAAITARLADAGFSAKRASANLGHNQARMTLLARAADTTRTEDSL
jgi:SAM-dependent methyltransferase